MNKVNVIFGGSTFVTLRESDLLNNNIIQFFSNFNCVFSVANLSKIDDFKVVLPKGVYSEKIEYSFEDKINKLDEAINNNEDIRIWTSHYDIESYLLFLRFTHPFECSIISSFDNLCSNFDSASKSSFFIQAGE